MNRRIGYKLLTLCMVTGISAQVSAGGGANQNVIKEGRSGSSPVRPGIAAPGAVRAQTKDELSYGAPIVYQNLSIVPVGTTKTGPFQKYTLLEAGLEAKTLEVRELRGSDSDAQVNDVEVRNKGKDPVYLLGGEMILGGKQDRIIQNDSVVPNDSKWTRVSVFCVEHGRWTGQNMKFSAGKALVDVSLQQAALSGDQGKVWAAVAAKNRQHGTESSTDTYRRTIQNQRLRKKIAPYREEILKLMPAGMQLSGLIFAINGKIRVADLFGNPILFSDLKDKLLSAYILEALGEKVVKDAPPINAGAAMDFVGKGRAAGKIMLKSKGSGRSVNYKIENDKQIGSETIDKGTGAKVRETYIMK
jgi:hypothetical protein